MSLPPGNEEMIDNIREVHSQIEKIRFIPRSDLGRKLLELRKKAIDEGMQLLSADEILEEVRRRRGEQNDDESPVSCYFCRSCQ
ncbi:MAG: hypothetical protein V1897_07385 [Pseudomonadota bacterium]